MIRFGIADLSVLKDKAMFENGFKLLPLYRQERVMKIKPGSGKRQSMGAFLLFMQMLNEFRIDGKKILIETDAFGKPFIHDMPEISFSLSHSEDYAICAITDEKNVGCDIEKVSHGNHEEIVKRFFSEKERLIFENAESAADVFFRLWTKKESFIKAIGMGLGCPLDAFSVDSREEGSVFFDYGRILSEALKHDADFDKKCLDWNYYVKNYETEDGYILALCFPDMDMPKICRYDLFR